VRKNYWKGSLLGGEKGAVGVIILIGGGRSRRLQGQKAFREEKKGRAPKKKGCMREKASDRWPVDAKKNTLRGIGEEGAATRRELSNPDADARHRENVGRRRTCPLGKAQRRIDESWEIFCYRGGGRLSSFKKKRSTKKR